MPTSLKFGTSGLRGLVSELDGPPAYLYARAFAEMVAAAAAPARAVLVARDLRASGPSIMARCLRAVADAGLVPVDCGEAPTPALALEAQRAGQPAIMVTGSHIPDDRNGLKFYEAKGEIDKADEAAILARLDALAGVAPSLGPPPGAERRDVVAPYLRRIVDF
ncbi:MAG: phosphomannomutase, partial [Hyphomicrobiales bacterium]|nr:phosphomannomutase [Hyphomicrobiales bacterium]